MVNTVEVLNVRIFMMDLEDPRNQLNFCISGLVHVECTEVLYYDNPELQNSVEIGDLAVLL